MPIATPPAVASAMPHSTSAVEFSGFEGDRRARNADKAEAVKRDFRTDTITIPTDDLYELMKDASRGDDVYGEDPDTVELQDRIAKLAGKEAALFCASGTMTNQLAIRAHLSSPPYSVVTDARAHVHLSEAGGIAFHSGATTFPVFPDNGHHLTVEEVLGACVPEDGDVHGAPTKLVCVENTLSGMIYPQPVLVALSSALSALPTPIPLHCDGARLWDVVAATGLSLAEACAPFETVSLCMSKGLGAPIGSVLVGPKKFIQKATHYRKLFGGGLRQTGGLALAASHCLTNTLPRLPGVHQLAKRLAAGLVQHGVGLQLPVETGMVWIDPAPAGFGMAQLASAAAEEGVKLSAAWGRLVVHFQTSEEAVDALIRVAGRLAEAHQAERAAWEEEAGTEEAQRVRRVSEGYARGEWRGRVEPPRNRLQGCGKGK
ncbi:hypothetical protein JCM10207_000439 [Rhodosporidiobolus poonsookiae]